MKKLLILLFLLPTLTFGQVVIDLSNPAYIYNRGKNIFLFDTINAIHDGDTIIIIPNNNDTSTFTTTADAFKIYGLIVTGSSISIDTAHINDLDVDTMTVDSMYVKIARIETLDADTISALKIYVVMLDVDTAHIKDLDADTLTADSLYSKIAGIDTLETDTARINKLFALVLTADSAYIKIIRNDTLISDTIYVLHTWVLNLYVDTLVADSSTLNLAVIDSLTMQSIILPDISQGADIGTSALPFNLFYNDSSSTNYLDIANYLTINQGRIYITDIPSGADTTLIADNGTQLIIASENIISLSPQGTGGTKFVDIYDDNKAGWFNVGRSDATEWSVLSILDGGADNKPGLLLLYKDDGNLNSLWFNTGNILRGLINAKPVDDDADGYAIIDLDDGTIGATTQNVLADNLTADSIDVDSVNANYIYVDKIAGATVSVDSLNVDTLVVNYIILPDASQGANIGSPALPFNLAYSDSFHGHWFGGFSDYVMGASGSNVTFYDDTVIANTLSATTIITPYTNVIIVAKAGGDYVSIVSALTDANAGDVIQIMAGDYYETIILKDSVDIIGVGNVYVRDTVSTGTSECVKDNDIQVFCRIQNITFVNTIGNCLRLGNVASEVNCVNVKLYTLNGHGFILSGGVNTKLTGVKAYCQGGAAKFGGYVHIGIAENCECYSTSNYGLRVHDLGTAINCYGYSTAQNGIHNTGIIKYCRGEVYNTNAVGIMNYNYAYKCYAKSVSGNQGFFNYGNNAESYHCIGVSDNQTGFTNGISSGGTSKSYNDIGISTSDEGYVIYPHSISINCSGYSNGGKEGFCSIGGTAISCSGHSNVPANRSMSVFNSAIFALGNHIGRLINCSATNDSSFTLGIQGDSCEVIGGSFVNTWNNVNGHAISISGAVNGTRIIGVECQVKNTGAHAINSDNAITVDYQITSNTDVKTAQITQKSSDYTFRSNKIVADLLTISGKSFFHDNINLLGGDTLLFTDPTGADTNIIANGVDTFYVGKGDNVTKLGNSITIGDSITANSKININTPTAGALTIGNGSSGINYYINFIGNANIGQILWDYDFPPAGRFEFNCGAKIDLLDIAVHLHTDTIFEYTADAGVYIDGVVIKDGNITADTIFGTSDSSYYANDSDSLDGEEGAYYLARTNHTGADAISDVTGLQDSLNKHTDTLETHRTDINTNIANIATNVSDISDLTDSISVLRDSITALNDRTGNINSNQVEDTDFDNTEILSTGIVTGFGLLIVRESVGAEGCVFLITMTTIEKIGTDATFTVTKDNAGTYNVYYDTDAFYIQNNVGDDKNIKAGLFGL